MKEERPAPKGFYLFLIKKFLGESANLSQKEWPREMKLAKYLYNKYPIPEFWKTLKLGFELKSLAWLRSEKGKHLLFIQKKLTQDLSTKKESFELLKEKLGENKLVPKRKKNLMDFLYEPKKN